MRSVSTDAWTKSDHDDRRTTAAEDGTRGPLVVGVPNEIKDNENRVALTPDGVVELVHHGHQVLVEAGAGVGSRFADEEYAAGRRQDRRRPPTRCSPRPT